MDNVQNCEVILICHRHKPVGLKATVPPRECGARHAWCTILVYVQATVPYRSFLHTTISSVAKNTVLCIGEGDRIWGKNPKHVVLRKKHYVLHFLIDRSVGSINGEDYAGVILQFMQRLVVGWLMDDEMERIWNKSDVV
jgi:hypothetical protein